MDKLDNWYPANRYAGWLLLIYGLVLLVGLVPVVILSFRYAHRLGKEYEADDGPQVP